MRNADGEGRGVDVRSASGGEPPDAGPRAAHKGVERLGIRHILARPRHPQTVGKTERFWGTLWRECASGAVFLDVEDARRRVGHSIDHYNFQRPHQGIGGLVPGGLADADSLLQVARQLWARQFIGHDTHGPRSGFDELFTALGRFEMGEDFAGDGAAFEVFADDGGREPPVLDHVHDVIGDLGPVPQDDVRVLAQDGEGHPAEEGRHRIPVSQAAHEGGFEAGREDLPEGRAGDAKGHEAVHEEEARGRDSQGEGPEEALRDEKPGILCHWRLRAVHLCPHQGQYKDMECMECALR
jgi:hypothetical protein